MLVLLGSGQIRSVLPVDVVLVGVAVVYQNPGILGVREPINKLDSPEVGRCQLGVNLYQSRNLCQRSLFSPRRTAGRSHPILCPGHLFFLSCVVKPHTIIISLSPGGSKPCFWFFWKKLLQFPSQPRRNPFLAVRQRPVPSQALPGLDGRVVDQEPVGMSAATLANPYRPVRAVGVAHLEATAWRAIQSRLNSFQHDLLSCSSAVPGGKPCACPLCLPLLTRCWLAQSGSP